MAKEYIERGAVAKKAICMHGFGNVKYVPLSAIMNQTAADVVEVPKTGIGDLSDGYHTFNELYHHRAVLFAAMCNTYPHLAWKSKKHDTGDMFEGMFIVGIETPEGQATYHYDVDPYWDMFHVKELNRAPVWDGHTPDEAIRRIPTIDPAPRWIPVTDRLPERDEKCLCRYTFGEKELMYFYQVLTYYATDPQPHFQHTLGDNGMRVTHWMPLPQPPEDGGAENGFQ